MFRLIPFELGKIWRKRSFLLAVLLLLATHVFLLWYTTLPKEGRPGLSSYKALSRELGGMEEQEKGKFLTKWKECVEGASFVETILMMQRIGGEMGESLKNQELARNPGIFEKYYQTCQNQECLYFTDSLEQEKALVDEVYKEWEKVAEYGEYLRSVQENRDTLSGISIFGGQKEDSYSARNLEKSARDYAGLTEKQVAFTPSKPVALAMECSWGKILLFLSLLLFVGSLITEEKEKRLFLVTRSTRRGVWHSIGAKLAALLAHCLATAALFYGSGLIFSGISAGWPNLLARLQSLAIYRESCLNISIAGYLLLAVATQGLVLFGIGALLVALSLRWDMAALPFLAGIGIGGISGILYYLIPAGSSLAILKYLNPMGWMETGQLYGGYLNLSLLGRPLSRLGLSLVLILVLATGGVAGSLAVFARLRSFGAKRLRLPLCLPFRPHTSILRHEGYKLLFTSRSLLVLLVFAALLAGKDMGHTYHPSVGEQYYRELMERLKGEFNQEKEELVKTEQKRYQEAFANLERIEAMEAEGSISSREAEDRKAKEYMTLSFYPAFQRVEEQYQRIREQGGSFVYDTGYLYLLGIWEDAFPIDLLILTVGIILGVSGALTMEYQTGSWNLLGATRAGRRSILLRKTLLSAAMALTLALIPPICRAISIARTYPMENLGAETGNITRFAHWPVSMPIALLLALFVLSQMAAAALAALATLAISLWRKQQAQTIFFALALLAVPILLKILGFEWAKWVSLYPIYGWTGL